MYAGPAGHGQPDRVLPKPRGVRPRHPVALDRRRGGWALHRNEQAGIGASRKHDELGVGQTTIGQRATSRRKLYVRASRPRLVSVTWAGGGHSSPQICFRYCASRSPELSGATCRVWRPVDAARGFADQVLSMRSHRNAIPSPSEKPPVTYRAICESRRNAISVESAAGRPRMP